MFFARIKSFFRSHLDEVEENYFEHMFWAIVFSSLFLVASLTCFLHSIFPFMFKKTGSTIANWILSRNNKRRGNIDE